MIRLVRLYFIFTKELNNFELIILQILLTYTFKDSDIQERTFFADTVIDVDPTKCDDAYVYNSDLGAYGVVVYSLAKNDSWRVNHNYFYFDPLNGKFSRT